MGAEGGAEQRFSHQWIGLRNQAMLHSISDVADFYYDAFGRLTATAWVTGAGNVDAYTDGPDMALELRNVFGGANRRWVRYVHGADDDQILAMELYPLGADPVPGTGQQYYFHPDAEGSVRLVTDAAAQVANRYDYDSYGRRVSVVESVAQPYGWKGREFLPGAGWGYSGRARFHHPVIGRFISEAHSATGRNSNLSGFGRSAPKNGRDLPAGLRWFAAPRQRRCRERRRCVWGQRVSTRRRALGPGAEVDGAVERWPARGGVQRSIFGCIFVYLVVCFIVETGVPIWVVSNFWGARHS